MIQNINHGNLQHVIRCRKMLCILLHGCRLLCEDQYTTLLTYLNSKLNSFIEISILKGKTKIQDNSSLTNEQFISRGKEQH